MNPISAGKPQWILGTPYRGKVNDAFIAKIKADPGLKPLLYVDSRRTGTLVLSDFFNDPKYNGGSEYDVYFSPLESQDEGGGWWRMSVGTTNGVKLFKFLEKALRVRPMLDPASP